MYSNKQIRRAIRKYVERKGAQNTRDIIRIFADAFHTPKQRISGNLRSLKYDDKTIRITTYIPATYSVMQ